MKNYKLYIIGLIGILIFISCNDFLSVDIKGIYTEKNFFKNEEAVVDAVTGLYGILIIEDFVAHGDYTWDVCSDDMFRAGDHSEDEALETFTLDAGNNMLKAGWKWKYEMISRANNLLINVPSMTNITDAIKKRSIGEAYFFRAFAYWWLYLPYGEIPLILEEDVRNTNYNKPKATVEEVLSQIEHDLLLAAENLDNTSTAGRITKGTAYAYLTQLYMHWASYEGKEGKLTNAIEAGAKVINNDLYKLAANYQSNFRQTTTATSEMLLYVASSSTWRNTSTIYYFSPRNLGGWNFFHPLPGLYQAFGNDPRREMTMWAEGDKIQVGNNLIDYEADKSETGYHFNKYTTFTADGRLNFDLLIPLMRSADVYLLVAEAKIRQSGPGAGDVEINAVRARVGLPPLQNAGKEELMKERRLELAGENRRHFDLVRWDKINWVDLPKLYADPISSHVTDVGRKKFIRPKHYFFPLPQEEIDKSSGILVQNSNYLIN
ncbi:RagB/SusD family nutrient uptake outer membrane protein [Parabacteroides bouchesdurhonensis]|uniref:RagB/SusD family nutrient uptake outer membrane protein n=1 Tax=Parabacteroides bouchesdurhonensis TaxID=1936995 RepID=UPI000E4D5A28|nr:RagB/SusD family nutrient uptake outer membrane protein [Parabacteroides bouchesdurhonensis]RHJ93647.1 RagB/SusD family nutrient uptake outer membrane protein [Bacteroides sp. AM07-16]